MLSVKCTWKYQQQKGSYFVQTSMCLYRWRILVVLPVKYECDLKNLPIILGRPQNPLTENLTNRTLVTRQLGIILNVRLANEGRCYNVQFAGRMHKMIPWQWNAFLNKKMSGKSLLITRQKADRMGYIQTTVSNQVGCMTSFTWYFTEARSRLSDCQ